MRRKPGIPAGLCRAALAALLLVTTPAPMAIAAAPATDRAYPALFGTSEVRSDRISLFPKWQGALSRYFDERRLAVAPCLPGILNRCHLREWTRFLDTLRGRDRRTQIAEVNRYMNRKRYIIDPRNYGVRDYWATPGQFLDRDGDCEDYAIAKFMSLRALGFDDRALRIVVLQDLNLDVAHAVLVVYYEGEILVLDNQVPTVVPARAIRHYRPIYSLNETSWWLHRR